MPLVLAAGGDIPPFFILLTTVLVGVVIVSLVLAKFRQSLLVGYFLCGVLISNSGLLEWVGVEQVEVIDALAEIGVVLLLFTLGIEFSLKEIKALRRPVFVGGGSQVLLCLLAGIGGGMLLGFNLSQGVLLGFAFSLSSTAVSMKSFQEMGLPESPQARTALGMAIFQDLAAILFMVLIPPLLSNEGGSGAVIAALIKGALFTACIVVLSRHGFPQMLDAVARTRSRELFTITVIGLCAGVALVSGLLGLSPALGAFAAGIVVSESIYSHRVLSDILPFKDLFLTVFFVSVGLLIDIDEMAVYWPSILAATVIILLVKGGIVALAARWSGLRKGSWMVTSAALCSTGEFSIVLLNKAGEFDALSTRWEQILLASTAFSMGLVPTLMKHSLKWADNIRRSSREFCGQTHETLGIGGQVESLRDHVVICGYGPVGQNLHRNLLEANVKVVVLETNPETVKRLHKMGVLCLFADAADKESLELAHTERARGIAFTFPDEQAVLKAMHGAQEVNPEIRIYARAKFVDQAERLKEAGVHFVLHDEEQSGLAMITAVMRCYEADIEPTWKV
ncbi:cation:proton antiporter [Rubritalea spongiae]|uniref:Cation:proton antiporter n=1 Tax=Rubritalea spongiae TaxID=430797 RepID=A0ABW5E0I0_9BACT